MLSSVSVKKFSIALICAFLLVACGRGVNEATDKKVSIDGIDFSATISRENSSVVLPADRFLLSMREHNELLYAMRVASTICAREEG